MNSFSAAITGKTAVNEDVVPVLAHRPQAAKRSDLEAAAVKKKRPLSTASAITGVREAQDQNIIPDDAETIDVSSLPPGSTTDPMTQDPSKEAPVPANPVYADSLPEPLMTPAVALVAPDVTPQALTPLDPSQVPQAQQALQQPPMQPQADKPIDPSEVMKILTGGGAPADQATAPGAPAATSSDAWESQMARTLQVPGSSFDTRLENRPVPEPPTGDSNSAKHLFNVMRKFRK